MNTLTLARSPARLHDRPATAARPLALVHPAPAVPDAASHEPATHAAHDDANRATAKAARYLGSPEREIEAWAQRALAARGPTVDARLDVAGALVAATPSTMRVRAVSAAAGAVATLLSAGVAAAASLAARWRRWRAWRNALHTARQLATLQDAVLHDIGLERSEILAAALESEGLANPRRTPRS